MLVVVQGSWMRGDYAFIFARELLKDRKQNRMERKCSWAFHLWLFHGNGISTRGFKVRLAVNFKSVSSISNT